MKTRFLTYAYLLFLLLGSVLPINSGSSVLSDSYTLHIRWDYLLHALVYIPLPVLLGFYLTGKSGKQPVPGSGKAGFWIRAVLYSILISALFELMQMVLPYRAFNINDLVANGVGAVLGSFAVLIFKPKSPFK